MEIHMSSTLESMSCYLFRDILLVCIEGEHRVTGTLNFFFFFKNTLKPAFEELSNLSDLLVYIYLKIMFGFIYNR